MKGEKEGKKERKKGGKKGVCTLNDDVHDNTGG